MKFSFGGGLNELNDIAIASDECISGQNFELGIGNTKFKRRAPFDLVETATNTSSIHGIMQLIQADGTKTTLVAAGTDIYTLDGSTWTDVGNVDSDSDFNAFQWELDDVLLIVDRELQTVVSEWDGSTFSTMTTGLGSDFYAKYGLTANGRAIFANIKTGTSTLNPHMLVLSAFEDHEDLDISSRAGAGGFSTGSEAGYLLTPDLKPINGLIEFKQDIVISTEGGKLYRLVGDDISNYRFESYYAGSAALGLNGFVDAGDDVFYMRKGGVIESLRATDQYGDVGTDDISLKIRNSTSGASAPRITYDRKNRKVLFWLSSEILVLFKDMLGGDLSPWSRYKTDHSSSFNTNSATYMEAPDSNDSTESVYFGGDNGEIFNLNGTGSAGDNGDTAIVARRKLPLQPTDLEEMLNGRVYYRRNGQCELTINLEWGDERYDSDIALTLKGSTDDLGNYFGGDVYFGGDFYFNEGVAGSGAPVSKGFSTVGHGSSVFATFEVSTVNEFEIDFVAVGEDEIEE